VVPKCLADGQIVRLGDFGSFYIRIKSEGATTEDGFNVSMIKDTKLHFRPGKEIENVLNNITFEKVSD
jgi:nucleoid DNA-binding protein